MVSGALFFKTLVLLFFRALFKRFRNPKSLHRSFSNGHASQFKFQRYTCLAQRSDDLLSDNTLIFSVEGSLLKSSSLFPYFMLVAFEAGSLLRALILFLLYPFICLVGYEMGLKIMVMVSFFGIKKESFTVGRAVLPKFFLEDVGLEGFEVLRRGGKRVVGVSDLPQVMVESFLRENLEIESVVGREVKEFCGYFVGVMEGRKQNVLLELEDIFQEEKLISCNFVGLTSFDRSLDHQFLSHCKEIYLVSAGDKRNWQILPRERYPKPLIFHDGRLAFRPTPLATLAMFMWIPFGCTLSIIRILIGISLPYNMLIPMLSFTGLRLKVTNPPLPVLVPPPNYYSSTVSKAAEDIKSRPKSKPKPKPKTKGILYACNHRTLLDPLYLSFGLKKPCTAVTYSLSRMSEFLAPIRTVRLTRDRDQDSKVMEKWLNRGDIIVFPEGTTCREPYLLRFSPLFSELSDDIVPVALDAHVSMFYGTTASGLKCMDPIFFLMNPFPIYTIQFLDNVRGTSSSSSSSSSSSGGQGHEKLRFDVANCVQSEIGNALGFECTRLTRKDKYLILAGNEGIVSTSSYNKN